MKTEAIILRDKNITTINGWMNDYQIAIHHENGYTILGLYKPAVSKTDIPEFIKDLIRGNNSAVNIYVQGMKDGINLIG